jgi:hypothetical protein
VILAVFGAGASHDSVPSWRPTEGRIDNDRPPLASGLFSTTQFREPLRYFSECQPIIPYLQVETPGETLEHKLQILQNEGADDPVRRRQIAAIRYYLHMAIWEVEQRWSEAHRITNYRTILDQLRRAASGSSVLISTFNYDRMIENALPSVGITIKNLEDYISDDRFKYFKLHGSVHWARQVELDDPKLEEMNDWGVASEMIRRVADLKITDHYRLVEGRPIGRVGGTALFPAIAIPVETKGDFECPSDHLNCLSDYLSKVRKMILVGWRGTEDHFVKLLKDKLPDATKMQVVAGRKDWGEEILERMISAGIADAGTSAVFDGGFTDYAFSRQAEAFLT